MPRKYGLFTDLQIRVLIGRSRGLTLREIARLLKTSHQNISIAEKRAYDNLEVAKRTILIYNIISSPIKLIIDKDTHLMDVPKIIVNECDRKGLRLRSDFTLIYKLIRFNASKCISGSRIIDPILIIVDETGMPHVYPFNEVRDLYTQLERLSQNIIGGYR